MTGFDILGIIGAIVTAIGSICSIISKSKTR